MHLFLGNKMWEVINFKIVKTIITFLLQTCSNRFTYFYQIQEYVE